MAHFQFVECCKQSWLESIKLKTIFLSFHIILQIHTDYSCLSHDHPCGHPISIIFLFVLIHLKCVYINTQHICATTYDIIKYHIHIITSSTYTNSCSRSFVGVLGLLPFLIRGSTIRKAALAASSA